MYLAVLCLLSSYVTIEFNVRRGGHGLAHAASLFSTSSEDDDGEDSGGGGSKSNPSAFNFASQAAGAIVLDKSPPTAKGYSHLLNDDMDKYGISPCDEKKWVVIGLSEDILVTSVALSNYEKYSSMLKEFQVLASTAYPTEKWINLGLYTAEPRLGEQTFNISDSPAHTRYLKFKFLSHYGSEDLCTLSQIKVSAQCSAGGLSTLLGCLLLGLLPWSAHPTRPSAHHSPPPKPHRDAGARHDGHRVVQAGGGALGQPHTGPAEPPQRGRRHRPGRRRQW